MLGDMIHLREAAPNAACEVHGLAADGLARKLVELMRERHGQGGVNVCRDCITRARADAEARL